MGRRGVGAVCSAIVVLAGAACTTTIDGSPTAVGPTAESLPADPGPPPTPPSHAGAAIESRRLGVHVIRPEEALPQAKESCAGAPRPTPQDTFTLFPQSDQRLLTRAGYSAGWYTCFERANGVGGAVGAFEFSDETRTQVLAAKLALRGVGPTGTRGRIPEMPEATVMQRSGPGGYPIAEAFVRRGRLLAYVVGDGLREGNQKPASAAQVFAAVAALLPRQSDLLADFTPTPIERLGQLDDDPRGLAHRLIQPTGDPDAGDGGYTLEMYGRIADKPDVEVPLLERHGLTEMYAKTGYDAQGATRRVELFELRDLDAATKVLQTEYLVVRDGVRANLKNPRQHVIASARCHSGWRTSLTGDRYIYQICLIAAGRYFLRVTVENAVSDQRDVTAMRKLLRTQLARTPK